MLNLKDLLNISSKIDNQVREDQEKAEKEKEEKKKSSNVLSVYLENGVKQRTIQLRLLPSPHVSEKLVVDNQPLNINYVYDYMHKITSGNTYLYTRCASTTNKALKTNVHKCPICEYIYKNNLYNDNIDEYNKLKSKRNFKANAYIYLDTMNPENNGKVVIIDLNNAKTLFQTLEKMWFGSKVEGTDRYIDEPRALFNLMAGPDITIGVTSKGGFPDYTVSLTRNDTKFLGGDMKKIEAVISQCHNLEKYIDPEQSLKKYEVAQEEFFKFMSGDINTMKSKDEVTQEEEKFNNELKEKYEAAEKEEQDEELPSFNKQPQKPTKDTTKAPVKDESDDFDPNDFFNN